MEWVKMKQYQKALVILKETAKATSKHNKLVKLEIETEEQEFKEILQKLIHGYKWHIEPRYSRTLTNEQLEAGIPANNSQWKGFIATIKQEAIWFLEERIAQSKPQWQIIAEKNGWAPK